MPHMTPFLAPCCEVTFQNPNIQRRSVGAVMALPVSSASKRRVQPDGSSMHRQVADLAGDLIGHTLDFCRECALIVPTTPANFHYSYTMHEVSQVSLGTRRPLEMCQVAFLKRCRVLRSFLHFLDRFARA